jgi:hypothetical protein
LDGELKAPLRTYVSNHIFGRRIAYHIEGGLFAAPPALVQSASQSIVQSPTAAFAPADELIRQVAAVSSCRREQFHLRLSVAEVLAGINRAEAALSIVDGLVREVQELHLDRWESPALLERICLLIQRCPKPADASSMLAWMAAFSRPAE